MKKITPCLWFDFNAEEAVNFYKSVFPSFEILETSHYPQGNPDLAGKVLTIVFRIFDQEFIALNGGPMYKFTEAVSFSVDCKDQEEIDYYWDKLSEGGSNMMCGWLKDKYGLSWQIVPSDIGKWISHPDPVKAQRAAQALFGMKKIDIAALKQAII